MRTYQSQVVDVPFATGVDQGTDPVLTKGLLEAENIRFDKAGSLSKRNGWHTVSTPQTIARSEFVAWVSVAASVPMETFAQDAVLPTGEHVVAGEHVFQADRDPVSGVVNGFMGVGVSPRLMATSTELGTSAIGQSDIAFDPVNGTYCVVYTRASWYASSTGEVTTGSGVATSVSMQIRRLSDNLKIYQRDFTFSNSADLPGIIDHPHVVWAAGAYHVAYCEQPRTSGTKTIKLAAIFPDQLVPVTQLVVSGVVAGMERIALHSPAGSNNIFLAVPNQGCLAKVYKYLYAAGSYTGAGSLNVGAYDGADPTGAVDLTSGPSGLKMSVVETPATGNSKLSVFSFANDLTGLTSGTLATFSTIPGSTGPVTRWQTGILDVAPSEFFTYASPHTAIESLAFTADSSTYAISYAHGGVNASSFVGLSKPFVYRDTSQADGPTNRGVNIVAAMGEPDKTTTDIAIMRFEASKTTVRTCNLFPLGAVCIRNPVTLTTNGSPLTGYGHITSIVPTNNFKLLVSLVPYVTKDEATLGMSQAPVQVVLVDPNYADVRSSADNAGQSAISGGLPTWFDGSSVELAASTNVLILNAVPGGGTGETGSLTTNARYSYVANLRLQTPSGKTHRSGISDIVQVDTGGNKRASMLLRYSGATDSKTLPGARYFIELWRSVANGSTFYKTYESEIVGTRSFQVIDGRSDASIQIAEQLPIPDGVTMFSRQQPPCAKMAWWAGQRYWLTECVDGSTWYSQVVVGEERPVFNPALRIPTSDGGKILGISDIDGTVVYVADNGVGSVLFDGDSPNLRPIATKSGCSNRHSIVSTPNGVMFAGVDCIYMLDRKMSVNRLDMAENYIGADTSSIRCAEYNVRHNEAIFFLKGDQADTVSAVVCSDIRDSLDWFKINVQTASSDRGRQVNGAKYITKHGRIAFLTSRGTFGYESTGSYVDKHLTDPKGYWIKMLARTPWMSPGGIQGYMRCWRAGLKFTNFGILPTADLKLEVFENHVGIDTFNDSPVQSKTYPYATDLDYYKDSRVMLRLRHQKTHAISVRFSDPGVSGANYPPDVGPSFRVQALALEVQVEGGTHQLPKGQRG